MIKKSQASLLMVAAGLALSGWSCSQSIAQNATNALVEHAVNSQTNGQANVDIDKGQVSFTGQDGSKVAYGSDLSIPADFPKDIPVYANTKVNATSMDKDNALISLQSQDKGSDIVAWYDSQLTGAGWKQNASMNMDNFMSRSYQKDNKTITLTVTGGSDNGGSVISVQMTTDTSASTDQTAPDAGSAQGS